MEQVSQKLGKQLDDLGYDENARDLIIKNSDMLSILLNINSPMSIIHLCSVLMGSEAEGTSLYRASSDIDLLYYNLFTEVTNDRESTMGHEACVYHLHMTREKTTPAGYTKLQVNSTCTDVLHLTINHEITNINGQFFLANKHDFITDEEKVPFNMLQHGPAFSAVEISTDLVYGYKSPKLPDDVAPWFHRDRPHGWPSPETCELFKKMGCFVVGVGHVSSPECNLEWRLSMSYQELYLMKNLNPTQYKCYILLKMVKSNLKQYCGDIISSYHCKTALFYTIEKTDQNIWVPENLYFCFQKCLQQLIEWVDKRKCPNYFIPEENMFEIKLTEGASSMIKVFLHKIAKNYSNKLLEMLKATTRPINKHIQFNVYVIKAHLIGLTKMQFQDNEIIFKKSTSRYLNEEKECFEYILKCMEDGISYVEEGNHKNSYRTFSGAAPFWLMNRNNPVSPIMSAAAMSFNEVDMISLLIYNKDANLKIFPMVIKQIQSRIAHLLLAKFVNNKDENTWLEANQYITAAGETAAMETIVKLAIVHYIRGNYHECTEGLLKWHPPCFNDRTVCCSQFNEELTNKYDEEFGEKLINKISKNIPEDRFQAKTEEKLTCIIFNTSELDMMPVPLIYEAYRIVHSVNEPLVELDLSVYVYFLRYKSYEQLNEEEMNSALLKLEESVLSDLQSPTLYHPDVALNVLGHIYVTKGWYRLALHCFKRSWEIIFVKRLVEPYIDDTGIMNDALKEKAITHNAAMWNVMLLLFSC